MKYVLLVWLLIGGIGEGIYCSAQNMEKVIRNGMPWFDDHGNIVNAHGACIVEEKGRYYLFGEWKSDESNAFPGFSCYSSDDLVNWKFERVVLTVQPDGILGPNRVGERVKVMKCPSTGEFVMFMHADDMGYKDPYIGYATCKTINGEYQLQGPLLYQGKPVQRWDMGTFQDTDGKGYLLIHHGPIYRLSDDYQSIEMEVAHVKGSGESPAMFKKDGIYYMLYSNLTSWEKNDNFYFTAQNAVVVARIYRKTNVCQSVFDFLAFVKSEPTENLVRYSVQIKLFFKLSGDRVCTHQNRHIAVFFAVSVQCVYGSRDLRRFVSIVVRLVILDAVVVLNFAPKVLFVAVGVVFYDVVCGFQNGRRAAIILFELINLCTGKILRKIQNIADFRAAPAVNGLIFVANNKQVSALFREQFYNVVLQFVGVLKLVLESSLIFFENVGTLREKLYSFEEEIVKIHAVALFEFLFITCVDLIYIVCVVVVVFDCVVIRLR